MHKITGTKVIENGSTWFVTASEEEQDAVVANAVLNSAGVSLARAEAFGFVMSWVAALGLLLLTFALMDTLAAWATQQRVEQSGMWYDGFLITDPYFFSVFDHGLPLVG